VGSLDGAGVSAPVVPSSGSVLTGAAAVDPSGSVAVVCAPPLLLMVTLDAT
jgi:hypothetical protein